MAYDAAPKSMSKTTTEPVENPTSNSREEEAQRIDVGFAWTSSTPTLRPHEDALEDLTVQMVRPAALAVKRTPATVSKSRAKIGDRPESGPISGMIEANWIGEQAASYTTTLPLVIPQKSCFFSWQ